MKFRSYIIAAMALIGFAACEDDLKDAPLEAAMECDRTEVLAGEKVCFTDMSTGNPARWDWTFEGGEPATSQLSSPEVVYTRPGTYTVTLRVGRKDKNSEKVYTQLINVEFPSEMTADFAADKLNAYNTDDVTFTDLSTGFPNKWAWTFTSADGKHTYTSDLAQPVLKFEPGLYTVTLDASSPKAQSTVTKKDYLNVIDRDAVATDFEASTSLLILEGGSVTFADKTMGRPEAWKWEFEGAATASSTERNPTVKYNKAGRYKVTLTASNDVNSSTLTKESYVMVLPADGLGMWLPFNGTYDDLGPEKVRVEEFKLGNYEINLRAPSRHAQGYSVRLDGNTKTNTDGYAILKLNDDDASRIPGGMMSSTMVIWIKVENTTLSQVGLFNRGRPAGAITWDTADKNQSQSWARLNKTWKSGEGYVRWYVNTTGAGSALAANSDDKNIIDGEWHCVTLVREVSAGNAVAKIYVDGTLSNASAQQQAKDTYRDNFYLGCTQQFTAAKRVQINNPLQGCLDDVMIYSRAFTAAEVAQLYNIMK